MEEKYQLSSESDENNESNQRLQDSMYQAEDEDAEFMMEKWVNAFLQIKDAIDKVSKSDHSS